MNFDIIDDVFIIYDISVEADAVFMKVISDSVLFILNSYAVDFDTEHNFDHSFNDMVSAGILNEKLKKVIINQREFTKLFKDRHIIIFLLRGLRLFIYMFQRVHALSSNG